MAKRVKKVTKKRKKIWYGIVAPKLFNEQKVGETYLMEPDTALGRHMKVNLMNLTRNIRNQNINITLKIDSFRDNLLRTVAIGYEISPTAVKKMVRRKRDKVDDSFVCKTKDNLTIRIKPLVMTRNKVNKPVRTAVRKGVIDFLKKKIVSHTLEDLFRMIVARKLQSEMSKAMHKIAPLRSSEIRVIKVIVPKKSMKAKQEAEALEAEAEKIKEEKEAEDKKKQAEAAKEAAPVEEEKTEEDENNDESDEDSDDKIEEADEDNDESDEDSDDETEEDSEKEENSKGE